VLRNSKHKDNPFVYHKGH